VDPAPLDWAAVVGCAEDSCDRPGEISDTDGKRRCNRHWIKKRRAFTSIKAPHNPSTASKPIRVTVVNAKAFSPWESLALGFLKAWAVTPTTPEGEPRADGVTAEWSFADRYFDSFDDTLATCIGRDFVGISATSPQYDDAHAIATAIKARSPNTQTILGGYHGTILATQLASDPVWDWIVVKEGEEAFLDVLNQNLGPWNQRSPVSPKIIEAEYLTVPQLESLRPDREFIRQRERNMEQAADENEGALICASFTSRGCPYQCNFCGSKEVWSRSSRYRSPTNILEEMEWLMRNMGMTLWKAADDLFTLNNKRTLEFCRLKKGWPWEPLRALPFGCNARVNGLTEEVIKELSEAGCQEMWLGAESGSELILAEMNKGIQLEQSIRVFEWCREYGISTRAYLLLGSPSETHETIEETRQFVHRLKPDTASATILAPYPGTLHSYLPVMHDEGHPDNCQFCAVFPGTEVGASYLDAVPSWRMVDEHGSYIWRTEALSNADLRAYQRKLHDEWEEFAELSHNARRHQDEAPEGF